MKGLGTDIQLCIGVHFRGVIGSPFHVHKVLDRREK